LDTQTTPKQKTLNEPEEIYDEDVQIIIKDGKYFFLHETLIADINTK
jgi:hypothetical protein